jgi:hypothetical protein
VDITIEARGTAAEGLFPHIILNVNDSLIGSWFVGEKTTRFHNRIILEKDLESVSLFFDNDLSTAEQDRNLNLVSFMINGKSIPIDERKFTLAPAESLHSGFRSDAQKIKKYLIDLGIRKSEIEIIEFMPEKRNNTLTAAVSFMDHIKNRDLRSLNIITSEMHSRRTWYTYKKMLPKDTESGVYYFNPASNRKKTLRYNLILFQNFVDEVVSYSMNWVYLNLVFDQQK